MPPLSDRVRHEFAALALGYHAAGRLAVHAGAGSLVSAHILHHAVEFVLKASLARHTTLAEMKKFGHRLPDLFASAEARSAELRNDEHRATAARLHELWETRFPDRILSEAATFSFAPGELADARRADVRSGSATGDMLALAPIDRLFSAGFRATGLNPAAFMERLGPEAQRALRTDDPGQAFLLNASEVG